MNYKALYRKYRPSLFNEIVGQDHIVKILKNSIIKNKIGHAYLFSGPRGTGKTSTAKIFASTINCLQPVDGEKCGKCAICKLEENVDIIEIDAASNNGVDEIREIRQNAKLMPNNSKYKVYIIDEVHMLSIGAFNALLKTLEEPPLHVIFILATTEFQKVPLTIVSRCQKFQFKKLTNNDIEKKLHEIVEKENINITDNALTLIAEISDGGLRDAINLLDQASSTIDGKITEKEISNITGTVLNEEIQKFINNLIDANIKEVLDFVNNLEDKGKNYVLFCEKVIILLRKSLIDFSIKGEKNKIQEYLKLIYSFINLNSEIKKSINQKILFEVKMLEIINENNNVETKDNNEDVFIKEKITKEQKINKKEEKPKEKLKKETPIEKGNIEQVNKIRINNTLALANKNILISYKAKYDLINDYLTNRKFSKIVPHLLSGKIVVAAEEKIIISVEDASAKQFLLNNLILTEEIFNKIFDKTIKVSFLTISEWNLEMNKYKENIKNNNKYEVIEEPEIIFNDSLSKIEEEALNIFGEEKVELK